MEKKFISGQVGSNRVVGVILDSPDSSLGLSWLELGGTFNLKRVYRKAGARLWEIKFFAFGHGCSPASLLLHCTEKELLALAPDAVRVEDAELRRKDAVEVIGLLLKELAKS